MPRLIPPALPPGRMGTVTQPSIAGDGSVPRPWQVSDSPALLIAYADPAIQRWNVRTLPDVAEAEQWIAARPSYPPGARGRGRPGPP